MNFERKILSLELYTEKKKVYNENIQYGDRKEVTYGKIWCS